MLHLSIHHVVLGLLLVIVMLYAILYYDWLYFIKPVWYKLLLGTS